MGTGEARDRDFEVMVRKEGVARREPQAGAWQRELSVDGGN